MDISEIDCVVRNTVGVDVGLLGELWLGSVVVDVEASDAVVVVVVDEEFGHVDGLVTDNQAERDIFVVVSWRQSWEGCFEKGLRHIGEEVCRCTAVEFGRWRSLKD